MDSIDYRISQLIRHLHLNINSFSKLIGLNNNVSIGNIVGGRKSKPSFELIQKIVQSVDGLNSDWLILGRGEMFKTDTNKTNEQTSGSSSVNESIFNYSGEAKGSQHEQRIKELEQIVEDLKVQRDEAVKDKNFYRDLLEKASK